MKIGTAIHNIFTRILLLIFFLSVFSETTLSAQEFVNELRSFGYGLIPAPQETSLTGNDIRVDHSWQVVSKSETGQVAEERLNYRGLESSGSGFYRHRDRRNST